MDMWLKVFIAFVVIQNVQTQSRTVVNTTCLELAKPSNQQYRLVCSHYDYHCLLDETYTQEFEVCREWKWIPGGKCAYYNTYGSGNVDEGECKPGINLTCSEHQFESKTNIQFTACYAKRGSSTSLSTTTTSPVQVSLNGTSKRDIATSYPSSKAWIVFLLYIVAVLLSIFAILFILRYKALFRKDDINETQRGDEEKVVDGTLCICFVPMKSDIEEAFFDAMEEMPDNYSKKQNKDKVMSTSGSKHDPSKIYIEKEDKEEVTAVFNDKQDSLRRIEQPIYATDARQITYKGNSSESISDNGLNQVVTYAVHEGEESTDVFDDTVNLQRIPTPTENTDTQDSLRRIDQLTYATDERPITNKENSLESTSGSGLHQVVTNAVNNKEESTDVFDDTVENLQRIPTPTDSQDSLRSIEQPTYATDKRPIANKENSLESTSGSGLNQVVTNAVNDEEESTDVFGDTVESLQRISPPTDDKERKLCTSLYKLLSDEGLKLSQEAMAAIITKTTGKPIKELVADKTVQKKVNGVLPEDLHHLVTTEKLREESIFVSYGLLQIFVNKDHPPKSGWSKPVRETDVGIGDDIERLYRIQTIVRGTSDPVTLSIESYIRLLDIMVNALSRLYPDVEFKEGFKAVVYALKDIKHPNMTNTMFKKLLSW